MVHQLLDPLPSLSIAGGVIFGAKTLACNLLSSAFTFSKGHGNTLAHMLSQNLEFKCGGFFQTAFLFSDSMLIIFCFYILTGLESVEDGKEHPGVPIQSFAWIIANKIKSTSYSCYSNKFFLFCFAYSIFCPFWTNQ